MVRHELLNQPSSPCNPSPSYNFGQCVEAKHATSVWQCTGVMCLRVPSPVESSYFIEVFQTVTPISISDSFLKCLCRFWKWESTFHLRSRRYTRCLLWLFHNIVKHRLHVCWRPGWWPWPAASPHGPGSRWSRSWWCHDAATGVSSLNTGQLCSNKEDLSFDIPFQYWVQQTCWPGQRWTGGHDTLHDAMHLLGVPSIYYLLTTRI